jgi:hypothetical protein
LKNKREVIKMEKRFVIFFALILTIIIASGSVTPVVGAIEEDKYSVEIGVTLEADGVGTIDRELMAQTEWGYNGERLTESLYTKWLGTNGLSNISFSSDMNVFIGDHVVCSRNYNVGAAAGFDTRGDNMKRFEIEMLSDSNYMELEGLFDGQTRLRHVVVDPTSRLKISKETTDFDGQFEIKWDAFAQELTYPGDEGDWLGCP